MIVYIYIYIIIWCAKYNIFFELMDFKHRLPHLFRPGEECLHRILFSSGVGHLRGAQQMTTGSQEPGIVVPVDSYLEVSINCGVSQNGWFIVIYHGQSIDDN